MIHVTAGTDTYGRVKTVSDTPIVTKFVMLQCLPVYPLQSYYFVGWGTEERQGIPFLASTHVANIQGVPLASLDLASVLMAYARAAFATLVVFGCMALVPLIMYLTGEQLDDVARLMTVGLLASLAAGTLGGLLTYAVPLTSRRERDVRRFCGEVLGVAADPARVRADLARRWGDFFDKPSAPPDGPRQRLIFQLISTRAKLAEAPRSVGLEAETDGLLAQLKRL